MLEQLWPQLSRDPPHLLESLPDRSACVSSSVAAVARARIGVAERIELEENAGEHLPDLVVKAAGDPSRSVSWAAQRPASAFAPLGLQAVEHLVERVYHASDLIARAQRRDAVRVQQIDGAPFGCPSLSSGTKARLSRTTFNVSATPSPTTMISASTSAIGALTVTGVTSNNTAIATSSHGIGREDAPEERETCRARTGGCDKLAGSHGLGLGKAQLRPPASLRRGDHHRTRGRTLKRPRERRARSPAQPPLSRRSQDDDVSALLGGDLSESPGPISHPRPSLLSARESLPPPRPGQTSARRCAAGRCTPHPRVSPRGRRPGAGRDDLAALPRAAAHPRARRVVHTAYDRSAQRHQTSRGQRFDETEQRSTFPAVAHMGR